VKPRLEPFRKEGHHPKKQVRRELIVVLEVPFQRGVGRNEKAFTDEGLQRRSRPPRAGS